MQGLGLEQISLIIAVVGVIIGVSIGLYELNDMKKARYAELFMTFQSQIFDPDFTEMITEINVKWSWTDHMNFWEKYGPESNPQAFAKFSSVGTFFDSMGVLLKTKLIHAKMVPEMMAIAIRDFWSKVGPIAEALSNDMQRPGAFDNIRHLYQQIMKVEK